MPQSCLLFVTIRMWSERCKSTSAANHSASWWAYPLTPKAPTGQHKSASAANLSEPWCSPGGQTERHKSPMPLLCWSSLGLTRTLGGATGRHKSTSAANPLQPQRPQEALTVMHKSLTPLICWAVLGQLLIPRGLTGRHKPTSVANLLKTRYPQVALTAQHKPSMPPNCRLLSGKYTPLRWATVKRKSCKAADLLQSRWSSAPPTVQRKSRRAANLLAGAEASGIFFTLYFFSFLFGYGASDVRSRMGCQSHCAWSGWPSEKMPHRRAVLYASRWRGNYSFLYISDSLS